MAEKFGILLRVDPGAGVLHQQTGVIAEHRANISSVDILEETDVEARVYFEVEMETDPQTLLDGLKRLAVVRDVLLVRTMDKIYGKRIIIVGGGAQVGQVAIGAISEADRHNIRGEHISVDTIPLVGEQPIAEAVRAVARLPRAKALVLAGSLMGGEIEKAVQEVRSKGLLVVSLNMAGSVPEAADLVVSDPVQAGVMTVMAIAETAKFSIARLRRRVF
jgi:energy-converting hydrogenase B subunit Q